MSDNSISVTGDLWLGKKNTDSILNTLRNVLCDAGHSVKMTAYSLTYSAEFFDLLESVLKKGIPATIIINKYNNVEFDRVRDLVSRLIRNYPNFIVKDFNSDDGDLHAKIIVIDHQLDNCQALIGSANLSWRGITKNHELLIKLTGESAETVGDLFELISQKASRINK
jgi:phosphatidylserine/phosphatidylglycerophosphate/cardiolipin synthase-like enzyme